MKYLPSLIIGLMLFFCLSLADSSSERKITSFKIIRDVVRMNVNKIDLPLRNDGKIGEDAKTWYPLGQTDRSVLFAGGFGLSGYVNGELRASWMASASLIEEWQAGKWGMTPSHPLAKFYMVNKTDSLGDPAFFEWANAVSLGADFIDEDGNGVYDPNIDRPAILGEKTIWTVFNDGTPINRRYLGTKPMGLEILQTVWAFDHGKELSDIIFFRFQIINVSDTTIQDLIFSIWDDPDIGYSDDDLIGCDTLSNMGYCFNDQADPQYGINPPALGVKILQGGLVDSPGDTAYVYRGITAGVDTLVGKRNLPLTAYMTYIGGNAFIPNPFNADIARYYQEGGLDGNGNPIVPTQWGTGGTTITNSNYFYSGDPVSGAGWIDTTPDDKRFLSSNGPFTMTPGDTQDIVFAYVVGQGDNVLNSILKMRERAEFVNTFFPFGRVLKILFSDTLISVDSTFAFGLNLYNMVGEDSIISSSWQIIEKPSGSQAQLIAGLNNSAGLDPDLPGSYFISCSAILSNGSVLADSLLVRAVANHPPFAALSVTPSIFDFGQSALADASSSYDPDGDKLRYFWQFPVGTSVQFTDSSKSVNFMPMHAGNGQVTVSVSDSFFSDLTSASYQVETIENGLNFIDSTSVDTIENPSLYLYITDIHVREDTIFAATNEGNLFIFLKLNGYQLVSSHFSFGYKFTLDKNILISYAGPDMIEIYQYDSNFLLNHKSSINVSRRGDLYFNYPYLILMQAQWPSYLRVYDLSDLNNPQNISNFYLGIFYGNISFSEEYATCYNFEYGIITFDISNPSQIVSLDTLDIFSAEAKQIEYTNERIYVLNGNEQGNEITVIDASQPDNLQQAGVITVHTIIPGYSDKPVFAINGYGNLLAVSCVDGLKIYDLTDPYNPYERVNFHNGYKSTITEWQYPDIYTNFFSTTKVGNHLYRVTYDSTWVGIKNTNLENPIPENFQLLQNYPNPFNAGSTIRYELPQPAKVRLVIYNLLGQRVKSLVQGQQSAGQYSVHWDGTSDAGLPVSSGIYIYRITVDNFVQSRKMMLLK